MPRTGLAWDERFAWYNAGDGVVLAPFYQPWEATDSRQSKERIREIIVASGLIEDLVPISPRLATEDELLSFHTRAYIHRVRALSDNGGGDAGDEGYDRRPYELDARAHG